MIIKLRVIEIVDTLKLQRSILDALFKKIQSECHAFSQSIDALCQQKIMNRTF